MRVKLLKWFAFAAVMAMVLSACTAPAGTTSPSQAPATGAEATEAPTAEAAAGTTEGSFTTPNPILSDVRVRQAIATCIDRDSLISSVYTYVPEDIKPQLRMDSFLPKTHWAYSGPYQDY